MIIYALCGLFVGLFGGSWGAYWVLNRKNAHAESGQAPSLPAGQPEITPEEQAEQRKTEEAIKAMYDGLMNLAMYTGKPTKESGDAQ